MRRALPLLMVCACALGGAHHAKLGSQAPRFTAETLNEEWSRVGEVDLEEALEAHPAVLLAFGASYCGPCMLEWPVLRDVAAEYRKLGLLVIFVVVDREPEGIEAMKTIATRQLGISSPLIGDQDGELAKRYRIDQLPQMYLIDAGGKVVWRNIGYQESTLRDLVARLEELL